MSEKTYLDYWLENELGNLEKKKRKKAKKKTFNEIHEQAIVDFLTGRLTKEQEERVWRDTIYPSFRVIVSGVMQMKKFHYFPKNLDREIVFEDTILWLIEKLDRFTPGLIGKNGQPVKAFSFLSTIAKNFILAKILKANKVIDNKADVETSIDLQILSEDTLSRMSDITSIENDSETAFEQAINEITRKIENIAYGHKDLSSDFVLVGETIIHIFKHWGSIDFEKKNDFVKIVVLYTGLKQTTVSTIFKNYKAVLEEAGLHDILVINENKKSSEQKFRIKRKSDEDLYDFCSLEEYELRMQAEENDLLKDEREQR